VTKLAARKNFRVMANDSQLGFYNNSLSLLTVAAVLLKRPPPRTHSDRGICERLSEWQLLYGPEQCIRCRLLGCTTNAFLAQSGGNGL
jgi:hypothetical protein